jgi:hypothetical protein
MYKPPVAETKCWMSFGVHPTDFDDEACEENVEYVKVNNETVTTRCDPGTRGCMPPAATNKSVIFPCIRWMDVTKELEQGKGSLTVAAKISQLVDECPLDNGALLSGIAEVTCWILDMPVVTTTTTTTTEAINPGRCPLQCKLCGCIANCSLTLEPMSKAGHKCLLGVSIRQTDFESPEELVEWISVNNKTIKTKCKPGKNQCLEKKIATTAFTHDAFPCVTGYDVTSLAAQNQTIDVSAKISLMVDECPSNGFLLDGFAEVICDGRKGPDNVQDAVPASSLLNSSSSPWSSNVSPAQATLANPNASKYTAPAKGKGKVKAKDPSPPAKGKGKVKAKDPSPVEQEPR